MRLTIVKDDNNVIIDGVLYKVDLSGLDANLNAVQWYDTNGEEEWKGNSPNTEITSIDPYQWVIDAWNEKRVRAENIASDPYYYYTPAEKAEAIKLDNKRKAQAAQDKSIRELEEEEVRVKYSIPTKMNNNDIQARKDHIVEVQVDIDSPPTDAAYNPPLPPGVTPPDVKSLVVTVTREEGWQGNLGFRVVLQAASDDCTPTNLALAVYTNPDCDGYLYTTGAFQHDAETGEYFAVCPAGQEPGDVDINMGLLYGAAKLSCFTMSAGVAEKKVYAYEEV